jgi:hypothetical protein
MSDTPIVMWILQVFWKQDLVTYNDDVSATSLNDDDDACYHLFVVCSPLANYTDRAIAAGQRS